MPESNFSASPAKVFVTSAYQDSEPIATFLNNAALDKYKVHTLASTPEEADFILFIENSRYHSDPFFKTLKKHPLVKKYPQKVFMYNPHDLPWFVLPGLYTCFPKKYFDSALVHACPYLETVNPHIQCDFSITPDYLFSFIGSIQSKPRKRILELKHARGFVASSIKNIMYGSQKPEAPQVEFARILANSKFNLCPKGIGTSTIRLFETMRAGRVPVIISDGWIRPAGPRWDDFAVFVPENQVHRIPEILEQEEESWLQKAKLAREEWEKYFAPDAVFHYFVESIATLKHKPRGFTFSANNFVHFFTYFVRKRFIHPIRNFILSFKK